jgi:hypothetical protein
MWRAPVVSLELLFDPGTLHDRALIVFILTTNVHSAEALSLTVG